MRDRRAVGAVREIQALFRDGTAAGLSDRQLLQRFASRGDQSAFAALVGKHGPMVLGVCRRIVRDRHEAEDAFQAAFLVLARRAGSIQVDDSLGRWLYTVARRIALRAEAGAPRRGGAEIDLDRLAAPDDPSRDDRWELRAAIDAELGRLPRPYRDVLGLCYLEGLTHEEAAQRLRWPLGTVKGRLARARGLLRGRLARRGLGVATGALATLLRPVSAPAALIEETVSAAVGFTASRAAVGGAFPMAVTLAREALGTMHMVKIKLASVVLLTFGLGVGLAGSVIGHRPGGAALIALADEPAGAQRPRPEAAGTAAGRTAGDVGKSSPAAAAERRWLDQSDVQLRHFDALIEEARRDVAKFEANARDSREALGELERRRQLIATRRAETQAKLGATNPGPASGHATRPATEGMKRVYSDYVVEPPDILLVEVLEALPGRAITGERLVRPDGRISLGFYGEVYVAGLTIAQVKEKVIEHLRKWLTDEALGLVASDGQKPAPVAPADSTRVMVDVAAYNSKFYYVQGDVGSPGRLHVTGSETVLDGINFAGGLLPTADPKQIRLVRPGPPGARGEQSLPVDLDAIVKRGDPTTNYQLMPGDRLIVARAAATEPPVAKADPERRIMERLDALAGELEAIRRELRKTPEPGSDPASRDPFRPRTSGRADEPRDEP
jgi:RNA polymerase sigma factor (sigma-70 family)